MYLSDLNLSSEEEAPVQGEPAPDMTGVVDSNFNSKVEQHATTEMQATAADLNKRFGALQGEVDILSKGRAADQVRIEQLSNENAAMQEQLRTLGVRPSVPGGEPAPTPPSPAPGPEGEPQPANYPPQPGGAVPPPTAFYPGNGAVQPRRSVISLYRYRTRSTVKRSSTTKGKRAGSCRISRQAVLRKAV
jgi:conjugal transfer pilus assembly protein TraB